MMRRALLSLLGVVPVAAGAQSLSVQGFVEMRVVSGAKQAAWLDGGLGKTRFGDGDAGIRGAGGLSLAWQATPSLLASASAQYVPGLHEPLDLIDATLRYRPASTTPTRWTATAGMFFPPVSLENDGVAWTSPWTLTPSAVNSWVGEELRVFGAELRMERRTERGSFDLRAALFGRNDPAGELLASRGWALGDTTSGLDANVGQPDTYAALVGDAVPMRFRPFAEIDRRVGWYAAAGWENGDDRARLLYYDNRTDPSREVDYRGRELYGWHTRFWSAGAQHRSGRWWWLGQAMTGKTRIAPESGVFDTGFSAGYLLAAIDVGDWQPVARVDLFNAAHRFNGRRGMLGEHGHAITFALNWRPAERVRVTAEVLRIDSERSQRRFEGLAPRQTDTQLQLALRLFR